MTLSSYGIRGMLALWLWALGTAAASLAAQGSPGDTTEFTYDTAEFTLERPDPQPPLLKGTWTGAGSRTLCGRAQAPVTVTLVLENRGYRPEDVGEPRGNTSGTISIDGHKEGATVAWYGQGHLRSDVLAKSYYPSDYGVRGPFSDYYLNLQGQDAWLGVGYYQTLAGVLFRKDAACANRGDLAEVLRVRLTKQ